MNGTKKQNIKFHLLAVFLIIILAFAISPVTLQNDTFYTIKIGELISQNGIDMQDHFSWHENLPYTYPHWAYDFVIYGIYNLLGMVGIYISTVMLAGILGVSIYVLNNKVSKNKIVSLIVSLFTIYLLKDFVAARAQLVTFILFTLTILFIEKFIETKKKRYFIYLLIIPILIANLHVAVWPFYFVLFIPYIAEGIIYSIKKLQPIICIKIAYKVVQRILAKGEKKDKIQNEIDNLYTEFENGIKNNKANSRENNIRINIEDNIEKNKKPIKRGYKIKLEQNTMFIWLVIVVLISILTGLCTPLKDVPYTYLLKTMQGNTTQNINEHLPLTLIENKEILITFALFLAILILTDTKIELRDFFMLGGLGLLCFMSRRQTSMFIIITNPIFSKLIVDMVQRYNSKAYKLIEKIINSIWRKDCYYFNSDVMLYIFLKTKNE